MFINIDIHLISTFVLSITILIFSLKLPLLHLHWKFFNLHVFVFVLIEKIIIHYEIYMLIAVKTFKNRFIQKS
jgi:hypothetical protein